MADQELPQSFYFQGQGILMSAERNETTGLPKSFREVGNCPEMSIELIRDFEEHQESMSGDQTVDEKRTTKLAARLKMILESFTTANLSLGFWGVDTTVAADTDVETTIDDETFEVGGICRLEPNIIGSSLVIKDSAGTPATLVEGTDYEIYSDFHGSIRVLNKSGYTAPFIATYDTNASESVAIFSGDAPVRWMRLEGVNAFRDNEEFLLECYKVEIDPISNFGAITNDQGQIELNADVLIDITKEKDSELGRFGRYLKDASS